jgi:NADH-quinone oxidoreductase subunit F
MLLASYALQVRNCFVYIRGEFDLPYRRLQFAVEEAYEAGYFGTGIGGTGILGTDFACDIVVYRGAGSYVCGEASALITSSAGKRGYPRNRPPRLTVRGLYQRPTVINNVESLANVTGIIRDGAAAFRSVGTPKSPGTQLVSISGHIARPGVYEVEYGYPVARFLFEDCGGMREGRALKCIVPGGISTKVLTAAEITDLNYDHKAFEAKGSQLGSGGMIAIAEGTCMVRLLQVMLRFYHHDSCGQCTPCREGMGWLHQSIDRIVAGRGRPGDIDTLIRVSEANDGTTICGMGDAAGYATVGILAKYREEFEYYIRHQRSMMGGVLDLAAMPAALQEAAHA